MNCLYFEINIYVNMFICLKVEVYSASTLHVITTTGKNIEREYINNIILKKFLYQCSC